MSPRAHEAKFYGRLRLIRNVWSAAKIFLETVILWNYFTPSLLVLNLCWHIFFRMGVGSGGGGWEADLRINFYSTLLC